MVRQEFVIVGCVLIAVGLALCIMGYNKSQPTAMDSVVSFLEDISGEKAPVEVRSDKSGAYALLIGGGLCFFAGVGFMLKSRAPCVTTNKDIEGDNT